MNYKELLTQNEARLSEFKSDRNHEKLKIKTYHINDDFHEAEKHEFYLELIERNINKTETAILQIQTIIDLEWNVDYHEKQLKTKSFLLESSKVNFTNWNQKN